MEDLPGFELYKEGWEAMLSGRFDTIPAQLLLMARTRLNDAGFQVAEHAQEAPPHLYLYRLLAEKHEDAHYMYNTYRQRLLKFCRAAERIQSNTTS